jgi:hypothetical protein
MIVKALTNQDVALIQRMSADQWYMRKAYARLYGLEIISHPADEELFRKFVVEVVSYRRSF